MTAEPNPEVDLTTVADAQAALKAAGVSYSGDLQALVTEVSAQIQSYLSRRIPSQDYVVTIDGVGGNKLSLINTPITAVVGVSVDGQSVSAAASPTAFGYVFSKHQVMIRGGWFTRGLQNITISYTGGFAVIPPDLQRACIEGIAAVVSLFAPGGDVRATSIKAGDTALTFGDPKAMAAMCLTTGVTSILNQWRRVAPI